MDYKKNVTMDPSGFVVLSEFVPGVILELRYYSTYNFIGDRIDGYTEPTALLTKEAATALKAASDEFAKKGFDCEVRFRRRRNKITFTTENYGISIKCTTVIPDNGAELYLALTGDQCALTDIRVF